MTLEKKTWESDRRTFLKAFIIGALGSPILAPYLSTQADAADLFQSLKQIDFGPKQRFSFQTLVQRAQAMSRKPWAPAIVKYSSKLHDIDYAAYQKIRFQKDKTLQRSERDLAAFQFFHLGRYFKEPVDIHLVSDGVAREITYTPAFFEIPKDHIAQKLPKDLGFAGFRVMEPHLESDWMAFLGASYFRASTPFDQYGLSARGLAIDTGLSRAEEFPRFTAFWLEPTQNDVNRLTLYAMLEGPSVTGAYKFDCHREKNMVMDIEARIFARKDVERLGVAPLTSMFWYGEGNRTQAIDWRPEIHDSDGLALWTGNGERIWRPLNNPPRVMTNVFEDDNPRGFGLLQRDRNFQNYQDDGVFYDRRPSVWVEPKENWGKGSVHLVEIPTIDETFDNIVAFWKPAQEVKAGEACSFTYKLHWLDDIPSLSTLAITRQTQTGIGGFPGQSQRQEKDIKKYVIDFKGNVFQGLTRDDPVMPIVTASQGQIIDPYAYPIVGQKNQWRLIFDLSPSGANVVDLRAYLKLGDKALTETWLSQYVV